MRCLLRDRRDGRLPLAITAIATVLAIGVIMTSCGIVPVAATVRADRPIHNAFGLQLNALTPDSSRPVAPQQSGIDTDDEDMETDDDDQLRRPSPATEIALRRLVIQAEQHHWAAGVIFDVGPNIASTLQSGPRVINMTDFSAELQTAMKEANADMSLSINLFLRSFDVSTQLRTIFKFAKVQKSAAMFHPSMFGPYGCLSCMRYRSSIAARFSLTQALRRVDQ